MADRLRIVTLPYAARPVTILDISDGVTYAPLRDSFKITPPARTQNVSQSSRRYGGGKVTGETHANGLIEVDLYINANTTADATFVAVERLLKELESPVEGRFLEWRPDGSTLSTFYELRGAGPWEPAYSWIVFQARKTMQLHVSAMVAPLAYGEYMDAIEDFTDLPYTNTRFSFRSGTSVGLNVATIGGSSSLTPIAGSATEYRMDYTGPGYSYGDCQVRVQATLGSTTVATGWKTGVQAKVQATGATYLDIYCDDNGTNSRLRIDTVIAGVRANLASSNAAVRVGTTGMFGPLSVRGRVEGDIVYAELFYSGSVHGQDSGLTVTPDLSLTTTLVTTAKTTFGAQVAGGVGLSFTLPTVSQTGISQFAVEPYTYRAGGALTAPVVIDLMGPIPGTAPAQVDFDIHQNEASVNNVWGMLGWYTRHADSALYATWSTNKKMFGLLDSSDASDQYSNLVSSPSGTMLGGSAVGATASTGNTLYAPVWSILKSAVGSVIASDDFMLDDLSVEVWARVFFSGHVATRITASLTSTYARTRYTDEWGTNGRVVPNSSAWKFIRLGSIHLPLSAVQTSSQLRVEVLTGPFDVGAWGLDYVMCVPSRQRAASPSGRPLDSTFPTIFPPLNSALRKRVRSNLSAAVGQSGLEYTGGVRDDVGLGGQQLEFQGGVSTSIVVKVSDQVPDDPTIASATQERAATTKSGFHFSVRPRYFLARGN